MSDIADKVDAWLEPLGDAPCGDDLEYDPDFMELLKVAAGKPETQFSAAEPPNWSAMVDLAESLLGRTRDVRVALLWGRGQLHDQGFIALPQTLRLVREWFDRYWDDVHPKPDPDDGDLFARMNSLAQFEDMDSFLGDVRQSAIVRSRSIGQLTVRDIEVALERISPRDDESPMSASAVQQMLTDAVAEDETLREVPAQAKEELRSLLALLDDKAGYGQAPSSGTLKDMINAVVRVMPAEAAGADADADLEGLLGGFSTDDDADSDSDAGQGRQQRSSGGGIGSIESRADAVRAIEQICAFLEQAEPSNPAQLLLKRAQRLIDKNFLELLKELAPDALSEVAKLMGVDPSSVEGNEY